MEKRERERISLLCFKMDLALENRFAVAKGEGGGRRMDREFGVSSCKLVYIEWINNKVLLYSTGN